MALSSPPTVRPVPPLVAQRRSKCCVCKDWILPGQEIRGVSDGNSGTAYAHKWCAPTLDDIRLEVGSAVDMAAGTDITVRWGDKDCPLCSYPEAFAALAAEFPPNLFFEEGWRPWLPGLPDERFVRPEDSPGEAEPVQPRVAEPPPQVRSVPPKEDTQPQPIPKAPDPAPAP